MCESQREIDNCFFLPISHSSSVPFSLDPSNNNSNFEQLKLLRELTQEQLMALLGAMQTSSSHKIPENNNIDAAKTKQVLRTCQVPEVMNDEYYGTSDMENRDAKEAESNTEGVKIIELNSNDDNRELSPAEKDKVENIARPARTKERRPSLPKNNTIPTVEFDDEEFSTPNSSPKDSRKNNLSSTKIENESEETVKADKNVQHLDVPKKTKTKSMKISKKLHLPKFSFWSHKSGKLSSGSENSSVASTENIVLATENSEKNDLEYFISLKGDLDSETQNGK
ncbi:hypothetical protein RUM44_000968 [Polyplax serrata]|uniref:Uncharacterized protein n=1 Tax=Polyplax serrata TaxID=468196 RepID=A0ABR1B6J1_POLSC